MSNDSRASALQRILNSMPLWDKWTVGEYLGSGSFSYVYAVYRQEGERSVSQALKWIPLPHPQKSYWEYNKDLLGQSDQTIHDYFRKISRAREDEFKQMMELSSSPHVTQCRNFTTYEREDEPGCDILIRMERLLPLDDYLASRSGFSERDTLRLGIHLCEALENCAILNIIHRDIKPGNIFVGFDEDGEAVYKLGDFGEARALSDGRTSTVSMTGTPSYMAPEVSNYQDQHADVDRYSLGIALYELVNNRKRPFEPQGVILTPNEVEASLRRRISGEPLPRPLNCSDGLWEVIRKACAFLPQDRYSSAAEMRAELERVAPETWALPPSTGKRSDSSYAPPPRGSPNNSGQQNNSASRGAKRGGVRVDEVTISAAGTPGGQPPSRGGYGGDTPITIAPPSRPKKTRWVWIPILLALAAVLAIGVYLLAHMDVLAMVSVDASSVGPNQARLDVTGVSSSDLIRYNAAGVALANGLTVSAKAGVNLAMLIPESVYAAAVERNGEFISETEFSTGEAVLMRDDTLELIGSVKVTPSESPVSLVSLKNAPIAEQEIHPSVSFQFFAFPNDLTMVDVLPDRVKNKPTLQIVLRESERVFFVDAQPLVWIIEDVEAEGTSNGSMRAFPFNSYTFSLDTVLDALWRHNGGKWPARSMTLELYLDGELLGSTPLGIQTSD
ncbi:MAG: protein kinase [Oscillospiraceae bacterium]|jgi:serine/threonine protein kinase|nr:protein kinase [Oscillospiraceae bacterium]